MKTKILPADPKAGYLAAKAEIDAAIQRVLQSGHYILGTEVAAFEKEFSAWLGTADTATVANGTDAIELALLAIGAAAGDEVVTVANTVTATISAIGSTGAKPVFVDVVADTMLMDLGALEKLLATPQAEKVKAIIPVHLYGLAVDMPRLLAMAAKHGATVIEDCAQAHGSLVGGKKAGTWAPLSTFSFYPTKNLGALGDGGAVTGADAALVAKVKQLRQYGWRQRYVSETPGRNSRLDEMQAAILRVRLTRLDAENVRREAIAQRYLAELSATPLQLPVVPAERTHTWHQFVVRTPKRAELQTSLASEEILSGVLYPVPIYRQPAYANSEASFPNTDRACAEVLSLPLHPGLSDAEVARVIAAVRGFFETV
ncbi:DegT/DnrJ/EryC1/StrS family aminotransferase [Oleiharenicola lentus]|uniref:DegT/DnrJ/EryC1/StrS family aminotransferase n=1 Tax=Oleiharenicola lentus TaxID=2508720 RepID=UPI003F668380